MRPIPRILLCALIGATLLSGRRRIALQSAGVALFSQRDARLLWIGAHPDDEALVSPLLGKVCVDLGGQCTLLVLTMGESGLCGLSECLPDLAAVRHQEMKEAARRLHAGLVQYRFRDGAAVTPEGVRAAWADEARGDKTLLGLIRAQIAAERPTVIITFDPRHGSSCHADHRAAAKLVVDAVSPLRAHAPLLFLETLVRQDQGIFSFSAVRASDLIQYDAKEHLPSVSGEAWEYLLQDVASHRSQFTGADLRALAVTSDSERVIYFSSTGFRGSDLCH